MRQQPEPCGSAGGVWRGERSEILDFEEPVGPIVGGKRVFQDGKRQKHVRDRYLCQSS